MPVRANISLPQRRRRCSFVLVLFFFVAAHGQTVRPSVDYTVTIDAGDLSHFSVGMKIHNAPDTLQLAFAQHTEYNEFFWKNLKNLSVESGGETVPVVLEDSALWRAVVRKPEVEVRYRFEMPNQSGPKRRSWQLFLRGTGGLVGGVQTFLYLLGHEDIRSRVTLAIPAGWQIATGLGREDKSKTYEAANVDQLVDSPILLGKLREWTVLIGGIPHHVVYWPLPDAVPFDTGTFVNDIGRIAKAATAIFGRAAYREYWFLLQDGADDALEHFNSLTLGTASAQLAQDPHAFDEEIAHEFFHTWNLVSIRPKEQTHVTYKETMPTPVLWWSEGVTIYYANKLLRQTGFQDSATYRREFASTIVAYLQSAGNTRFSPEHASLTADHPDPADSGYTASYYTQGMLFGQLLDIAIRDSTGMQKGLDDVMKSMFEQFPRTTGFTDSDLERTAGGICGCDLYPFFEDHIRGTKPLDLEPYLRSIGLQAVIRRVTATDSTGRPVPDLRVYAFTQLDNGHVRIYIYAVPTAWWRAGLRTGDDLLTVDGETIVSAVQFRALLAQRKLGDSLVVQYLRKGVKEQTTVHLTSYDVVNVELKDLPHPSPLQQEMLRRWIAGTL